MSMSPGQDPVLLRWRASGRVIHAVAHDGVSVIGLMDSEKLASEAAEAHNEALTGKATNG